MKISQMTTETAADVLCRIAEPCERIGTDDVLAEYIGDWARRAKDVSAQDRSTKNLVSFVMSAVGKIVPALLGKGTHRDDVFEIVSAMTGKDVEEVRQQLITVTIADVKAFIDEDFINFFTPAAQ